VVRQRWFRNHADAGNDVDTFLPVNELVQFGYDSSAGAGLMTDYRPGGRLPDLAVEALTIPNLSLVSPVGGSMHIR
jgi:hypothetical protein